MIRRIRGRFIRIALLVLALAMAALALVINAANWINTRAELTETLTYLAEHGGSYGRGIRGRRSRGFQNRLDESRFFTVYLSSDGGLLLRDTSRVTDYTGEELDDIASRALSRGRSGGFQGDFLFMVTASEGSGQLAVFLNCATRLAALRKLALISAAAWAGGVLLAWLLVALFSRRAIQPLIDNAVRQKQFITDAGHELKTPLTVISANMDLLAMESGDSEWVRSTKKQVSNLRALVNELIYLSRLDEEAAPALQRLDLAALLIDEAEPFQAMAEFQGKALSLDAGAAARVRGDGAMLRRLISVLLDNAVKYAPEGDAITAAVKPGGRRVTLTVENGLRQPLPREALKHLFDRFYRADASRNREKGGFGIGLSVAKAIAEKHGGRIGVHQTDAVRLRFTVSLPAAGRGAEESKG